MTLSLMRNCVSCRLYRHFKNTFKVIGSPRKVLEFFVETDLWTL